MRTRSLKLYGGSQTATVNAAASTQIVRPALIVGVLWNLVVSATTGSVWAIVELSFQNTAQSTTNEVSTVISQAQTSGLLVTSGVHGGVNFCDVGLAVPVNPGDKLYINVTIQGTLTLVSHCIVHLSE